MSTDQVPAPGPRPLLEVVVLHPRDVTGADEGGADRLFVVAGPVEPAGVGRSPEPATVSAIVKETDLPVRVVLRLSETLTASGAELIRLVGLAQEYVATGVEGVSFGFLDLDLTVDAEACRELAVALDGVPWTFDHAVDVTLETDLAWRRLRGLPGLDAVLSAGSSLGLATGAEDLIARAGSDPGVARLLMAGGGLQGEHVPWLVRAGVRQFQVAASVRPDHSWKAHVAAGHVRAWRMLLDDACDLAAGVPTG